MTAHEQGDKVTADSWLRLMMKIGIPMAAISILSLWVGQLAGIPWLFPLFLVTGAVALLMGLLYNIRFVLLSVRRAQDQTSGDEPSDR